jgi:hypothetical protein
MGEEGRARWTVAGHLHFPLALLLVRRGEGDLAAVAFTPLWGCMDDMHGLLERFPLPRPRIVHPYGT